jgi:hypothetical protein
VASYRSDPVDSDIVSGLREPFITQQTERWLLGVSDFLSWFVRAGFGEPISWGQHNVITVRLTRLGMRFLEATEDPVEAQELLVSAGRQLPMIWSLVR